MNCLVLSEGSNYQANTVIPQGEGSNYQANTVIPQGEGSNNQANTAIPQGEGAAPLMSEPAIGNNPELVCSTFHLYNLSPMFHPNTVLTFFLGFPFSSPEICMDFSFCT